MSGMRPPIVSLILAALSLPGIALADPPTRVGRVSYVAGDVGVRSNGGDWRPAGINYPITSGQSVRTVGSAGAGVRVGAIAIVLGNATALAIGRLDDEVAQFAVPQGRIEIDLRHLGEGQSVEVDIPRGGVWLLQPG